MAEPHPYWRYDHRGTLRLRLVDWLGLVFLARHVLFTIVLGVAEGKSHVGLGREFGVLLEPWFMLADIPALALLLAAMNRVPKAGGALRALWRHGHWAVALSCALYVGVLVRFALDPAYDPDALAYWALGLTLGVGAYAFFGRYPRDLFASFPAADAS